MARTVPLRRHAEKIKPAEPPRPVRVYIHTIGKSSCPFAPNSLTYDRVARAKTDESNTTRAKIRICVCLSLHLSPFLSFFFSALFSHLRLSFSTATWAIYRTLIDDTGHESVTMSKHNLWNTHLNTLMYSVARTPWLNISILHNVRCLSDHGLRRMWQISSPYRNKTKQLTDINFSRRILMY